MEKLLDELYYNPKTGFIGVTPLYQKAKMINPDIKLNDVKEWLKSQSVNQQHRQNTKKISFLPIFTGKSGNFQIDLTFMPKFKQANRGFEVILTCINITTRKGYAYKSKNKNTTSILEMLQQFIKDAKPEVITSDNGSEFIDRKVKALFKEHNIEQFYAEAGNKTKMAMVERWNRTLKDRMGKYFTSLDKPIWYDILDDIVENYNNTVHSSIKQTPNSVNKKDEQRIISKARKKTNMILKSRKPLEVGDRIRVPLSKDLFSKGEPSFSSKIYTITEISQNGAIKVKDNDKKYKYNDVLPISESQTKVIDGKEVTREKINKVVKEHKTTRKLKMEGIDSKNIIQGRTRTEKIKIQEPTISPEKSKVIKIQEPTISPEKSKVIKGKTNKFKGRALF